MRISPAVVIPEDELEFKAIRASGPGGQNVNKLASAVQLRFDVRASRALSDEIKQRLLAFRDHRITVSGEIVIKAQESRSQSRNKQAARERLRELVQAALKPEAPRLKTKRPRAADLRRLELKSRRGRLKKSRGRVDED